MKLCWGCEKWHVEAVKSGMLDERIEMENLENSYTVFFYSNHYNPK